jgi:DNA-binding CsgD family transcriptional regulator
MTDPAAPPDSYATTGSGAADTGWSVSSQHGEAARMLATCLLRLAEANDDSGLRWWAAQLRLASGFSSMAVPEGHSEVTAAEMGTGPGQPEGILTPREFEVAALISQGMTNRRIAAELRISDPTASTHVRNILSKLGMGHRSQVASWVVRQQFYACLWDMVSRVADEVVASGPDRKPPSTQFERLT